MKEKGTVKRFFEFNYTELTAVSEYLQKQEEKGLRLKDIRDRRFIFEKAEPRSIRYDVDLYNGDSKEEFIKSCECEGWEFVTADAESLYVFRTQKEDTVDIVTDDEGKYSSVKSTAFFQPKLICMYIAFIAQILNCALRLMRFDKIDIWYDFSFWFIAVFGVVFFGIFLLVNVSDIFCWLRHSKKAIRWSEKIEHLSLTEVIKKQHRQFFIFAVVASVILFGIFFLDSGYAEDRGLYWFFILLIGFGYNNSEAFRIQPKKEKVKKSIAIAAVFIILCVQNYLLININENKQGAIRKDYMISYEDFGVDGLTYDSEVDGNGTTFAQFYKYRICCEDANLPEGFSDTFRYEILVSDYEKPRQAYVDEILADYEDVEYQVLYNTNWDILYSFKIGDGSDNCAMAIKDNTIIFGRFAGVPENNFYDIAYTKLFPAE